MDVKEKAAIRKLKEAEAIWPDTLWLYSAAGSLCVMRKAEDGQRAMTEIGGVDENYMVDEIEIENDGGDW